MKNTFPQYVVLVYIGIYILSNSIFVSLNENVALDSNSYIYWLRHGIVVFIALFSIPFFAKKDIYLLLNISAISLIYLLSNQILFGLMSLALAFSCILLGKGLKIICYDKRYLIFLIFFFAITPLLINLPEFIENGFMNTRYGRERMLLGYFHPKEAAQPFLITTILLYISLPRYRLLISIIGLILLFYISSKNAILYLLVFIFLTSKFKGKSIIFFIFFSFVLFYLIIVISNFYSFLDEFSSDRLTAWTTVIQGQTDNGTEQFRADSFYIELYIKGGIIGVAIFLIWLFSFLILNNPFKGIFVSLPIGVSLMISLLFYAGIDSGITSTGSLVHLFSWSMYGSLPRKLI